MLLTQALASSAPDIDVALAPAGAVERVVQASAVLSPECQAAYLECRPACGADQVDLLVCAVRTGSLTVPTFRTDGDPGWQAAERVQRERRTAGHVLARQSPLVWLEFDGAGGLDALPSPSVCVCVEPAYLEDVRYLDRRPDAPGEAVRSVAGIAGLPSATLDRALDCLRALPRSARLIHFSWMGARAVPATKLYLRLATGDARDFLQRIRWDGDRQAIDDLLALRAPSDAWVHLDVSLLDGRVLPRIAVAFPRDTDGSRFSHDVLEHLARGVLDAAERERVRAAGDRWIAREPVVRLPGGGAHVVRRWVDQKIVLDQGRRELKLYLAVRPVPALFSGFAREGRDG